MKHIYTISRSVLVAFLFITALQSVEAGMPPLIRRKVLFNDVDRTDAQISPDGRKLASLAKRNGVVNLWVRTVGTYVDSAITNELKYDVLSYKWAQDGKHLLYVSKREDGKQHLLTADTSGAAVNDLTPQGAEGLKFLSLNPRFHDEVIMSVDLSGKGEYAAIRINVNSGKRKVVGDNRGDIVEWYVDNNFKVRAALAMSDKMVFTLLCRPDEDAKWSPAGEWTLPDGQPTIWGFNSTNTAVYADDPRGSNTSRAVEISLADGTVKVISTDNTYDAGEILSSPVDHHVQAVFYNRDRLSWSLVDTSFTRDSLFLGYMDGDNTIVSRDNNDSLWVVRSDRDVWPVRYVLYNHKKRVSNVQFTERPSLEKYLLTTRNPIDFPNRDGETIHGYLTLPNGLDPDTAAMVVMVHGGPIQTSFGGPWRRESWGFDATTQWLANRGYAVLQINFRGSSGYGLHYLNNQGSDGVWAIHRDIIDGVKWVLSQGFIDSTRIAIWGDGYGAYSSLLQLIKNSDMFVCAVGVSDAKFPDLQNDYKNFAGIGNRSGLRMHWGDHIRQEPSLADDVLGIVKPVLISTGVYGFPGEPPIKNLQEHNKAVEYLYFPDEAHGFTKPENRLKFYESAEEFLGKYLKGRIE